MSGTVYPEIRWAQRSSSSSPEKNILYLTVCVPDLEDEKISLSPKSFSIEGHDGTNKYSAKFDFYEEIVPEKSLRHKSGQGYVFVLRKKEAKDEFWPRLTLDKTRRLWIKTDFDKWVDEDEQEGAANPDTSGMENLDLQSLMGAAGGGGSAGGMDFSQLAAGGGGGAGGMDFSQLAAGLDQGAADDQENDETSSKIAEADEEVEKQ